MAPAADQNLAIWACREARVRREHGSDRLVDRSGFHAAVSLGSLERARLDPIAGLAPRAGAGTARALQGPTIRFEAQPAAFGLIEVAAIDCADHPFRAGEQGRRLGWPGSRRCARKLAPSLHPAAGGAKGQHAVRPEREVRGRAEQPDDRILLRGEVAASDQGLHRAAGIEAVAVKHGEAPEIVAAG